MYKRKTKMGSDFRIIIVACILLLNALGFSYAYWNEFFEIGASLSLGKLDVEFSDSSCHIEGISEGGRADITVDGNTINIEAVINKGDMVKLYYNVKNTGTIPVKLKLYDDSVPEQEGLDLYLEDPGDIIEPGDEYSEDKRPVLNIYGIEPGTYNFDIELKYCQWFD